MKFEEGVRRAAAVGRSRRLVAVLPIAVVLVSLAGCKTGADGNGSRPGSPSSTSAGQATELTEQAIGDAAARSAPGGLSDPRAVALPPAPDADTGAWLKGEAAPLAAMVTATAALWKDGQGSCAPVAESMDGLGTPQQLLGLAAGTPDEPTRELLLGLVTTAGGTLAACGDSSTFDARVAEFAWQWSLTERRLVELGVHR